MDLANMRWQGVHHLIAYCLNDSCRHQALIDVSKYGDNVEVPSFRGPRQVSEMRQHARRRRPNWKEKAGMPDNWEGRSAWDK
jgi:hypothetical protein